MRKLLVLFVFLLIGGVQVALAQKLLKGKVTSSEDGSGIPGASIVVVGTNIGTVTNQDGNFSISIPANAKTLKVSFVGMKSQDIQIGSKTEFSIKLESEFTSLDEVVAIGYGSSKKRDLTGAVSSVKGNDLVQLPTMRSDQALQGRAAGVSVQNTDGEPGGNVTIRIRGGNSITGGNSALVVIDGMQGGNLNTINPNDIESMEVLKDASATAIYGARGANGVILITTKKGAQGKPVVNYSYNAGIQTLAHKLELLSAGDFARKSNAYAASQNGTPSSPITPILPFTDQQIASYDENGGTDWQNEIFRSGLLQNHLLSISGGSENTKYFISGGYVDQEGILIETKYKRFTLRSNLETKINSWLKAGVNLNLVKDKGNVPPTGEGTYFGDILGQVVNTVARFDPLTPVYNADGNYNFKALKGGPDKTKGYADPDVWNPVALAKETKAEKTNNTNDINAFLEFALAKGLTLRVTGAVSTNNMDNKVYYGSKTQPGAGTNGLGKLEFDKYEFYQNSNILTYDNTFKEKHHLILTGVAEQQSSIEKYTYIEAQGFFTDDTGIDDLGGAGQINSRTNSTTKTAINSFLGRANYIFDNKYLFTISYRADGSSVFGENTKWGYFPSGALAWKASEEGFVKELNIFSDLKLRSSWGKTGNQGIQPYQTLASVTSGYNYPYLGDGSTSIGFALGNAANPNLKWETTTQTDLGLDLGFFNQRLTATIDVYKKKTEDLLLNQQLAGYTGFSTILTNIGSIENKGLEFSIGATPVAQKDINWTTNFNISFNRSKILALATSDPLQIITNTGGGYNIWRNGAYSLKNLVVGQPVEQMYGYTCLGTWSEAERAEALKYGQLPGDQKWKDVNGDGKIDKAHDGNEIIGDAAPDYIFGWNNSITFKNFNLSFLIQGTQGNKIFNAVRIKTESPVYGTGVNLNNRWTSENQNTNVPAFTDTQTRTIQLQGHSSKISMGTDNRSSRYIEDGSYIRLKNISLTYNLPQALLNSINVSRLSVFLSASNLITITNYSGYDPEVSSFNKGSRVRAGGLGIDLSNYPTAKTVSCGINLTF
ncbi:MAG: TonB-dependent receptor [Prolixibacteraceae bacterium]|nr:TonB-dependent receptor [Prolixibacteraceae bacterium]